MAVGLAVLPAVTLTAQPNWLQDFEDQQPTVAYSTFAPDGFPGLDKPSIAVDQQGNLHLAAHEYTYQSIFSNGQPMFLVVRAAFSKLNAAGDGYLYTRNYFHLRGTSVAVDQGGNAYYAGVLDPEVEFATTTGALNQPGGRGVVLKLSPEGDVLYAARFSAQAEAITVDTAGRVYATGVALSDFTASEGSYKPRIGEIRCSERYGLNPYACPDAFAMRLSADGSAIEWATFFGGVQDESGAAIAIDSTGVVYIAGKTVSTDMPTTPGAAQREFGGGETFGPFSYGDGFLAKFSADGSTLLYSTYMGGSRADFVTGLAISADDAVTLTGTTQSPDFPVSANALQPGYGGGPEQPAQSGDMFIVQIDSARALSQSSYLGGSEAEISGSVVALPDGRLAIAATVPDSDACGRPGRIVILSGGKVEQVFDLPISGYVAGPALAAGEGNTVYVAGAAVGPAPFLLSENAPSRIGNMLLQHVELADKDQPAPSCLSNAASLRVGSNRVGFTSVIAPGEIISIFGHDLGPSDGVASELGEDHRLPTAIAGTRVLVNGQAIPLLYVGERQINAIAPFDLPGDRSTFQIESENAKTREYEISNVAALPGIFTIGGYGFGFAAVLNDDGTLNSPENPARRGSIVSIYATGLGRLTPTPRDGSIVPIDPPFPTLANSLQLYITAPVETGAAGMEVLYAGAAPGQVAGLVQINARIPMTAGVHAAESIRIVMDSTFELSQEAVTIAVVE